MGMRKGRRNRREEPPAEPAFAAAGTPASPEAGSAGPLLRLDGVSFAYPGRPNTLSDVSLTVASGELTTLLGPNGSGKSTLLNCIMHLLEPQSGTIELDGVPVAGMTARTIAQSVAYVPQSANVAFAYDVRDYVAMGRAPFLRLYTAPGSDDYELVDAALERLGIADLADRAYSELSGGQRQLVDVARALAQCPRLILFDEPTSALDYGNQVKVLRMVGELAREGYAVVMTTHNPDHPILLDSTVCLLGRDGRLVKGTVDEIMREDMLREVYLSDLMIRYMEDAGRRVCVTPRFA